MQNTKIHYFQKSGEEYEANNLKRSPEAPIYSQVTINQLGQ